MCFGATGQPERRRHHLRAPECGELWIEVKDQADRLKGSPGLKPVVRSNRICQGKTMFYVENDKVGA